MLLVPVGLAQAIGSELAVHAFAAPYLGASGQAVVGLLEALATIVLVDGRWRRAARAVLLVTLALVALDRHGALGGGASAPLLLALLILGADPAALRLGARLRALKRTARVAPDPSSEPRR